MADRPSKLSVIIPVRNEGVNLKVMLKILSVSIEVPHELLVVYDSLDDDSIPVVEGVRKIYPTIKGVHNTLGRGVKNAILAGVQQAKGEYVFIIAADDIGPVLAIEDMIHLMDKEGCDLVSATRYAHGGGYYGGAWISHTLSRIANKMFYYLSGRRSLTDSTLGIKMFRPEILTKIKLDSNVGWSVAFELSIKAQLAGFKLGEVPTISINRFYGGKSSFKLGPWVMQYSKIFWWGLKSLYFPNAARSDMKLRIPEKIVYRRPSQ